MMDVTINERIPGTRKRLHEFTAIEDRTRIRVLKVYDSLQSAHRHPLPLRGLKATPFRILSERTTTTTIALARLCNAEPCTND